MGIPRAHSNTQFLTLPDLRMELPFDWDAGTVQVCTGPPAATERAARWPRQIARFITIAVLVAQSPPVPRYSVRLRYQPRNLVQETGATPAHAGSIAVWGPLRIPIRIDVVMAIYVFGPATLNKARPLVTFESGGILPTILGDRYLEPIVARSKGAIRNGYAFSFPGGDRVKGSAAFRIDYKLVDRAKASSFGRTDLATAQFANSMNGAGLLRPRC